MINSSITSQATNRAAAGGFTLIELSIVLVIIALIVGGITGGKMLAHQSRVQSIITDINTIKVATNVFSVQYAALAGDFSHATDYWSGKTSNGDGNNFLTERDPFWQHLALAELIKGTYKDRSAGWPVSSYQTRFEGVAFDPIGNWPTYARVGNQLGLGSYVTSSNICCIDGGVMIAKDAETIDRKIDDGIAGSGAVMASPDNDQWGGKCTTGTWGDPATPVSQYIRSDTTNKCVMYFWLDDVRQ